jgi:hypothetical protein
MHRRKTIICNIHCEGCYRVNGRDESIRLHHTYSAAQVSVWPEAIRSVSGWLAMQPHKDRISRAGKRARATPNWGGVTKISKIRPPNPIPPIHISLVLPERKYRICVSGGHGYDGAWFAYPPARFYSQFQLSHHSAPADRFGARPE